MSELVPMSEAAIFDLVVRQAEVLAQSSIIPSAYRRKSADIIAAGLAGRCFGWDVMTSLRQFHVIEGTASLKPESMLGLVRQAGHSVTVELDPGIAVARGTRFDTGDEHVATFTMEDAKAAGLADKKNWKQYRDAMLTWRAVTKLCRVLFPDVVLGAGYTPEEVGSDDPMVKITAIEAEVVPSLSIIEAKTALLKACDGDKQIAAGIWGGLTSCDQSQLDSMCEMGGAMVELKTKPLPSSDGQQTEA
jgi:hypothetical protein